MILRLFQSWVLHLKKNISIGTRRINTIWVSKGTTKDGIERLTQGWFNRLWLGLVGSSIFWGSILVEIWLQRTGSTTWKRFWFIWLEDSSKKEGNDNKRTKWLYWKFLSPQKKDRSITIERIKWMWTKRVWILLRWLELISSRNHWLS